MNTTNITDNTAIDDLQKQYDRLGAEARKNIAQDMTSRDIGAIVWGANLFGSTEYPLFSSNGKEVTLKGFRLEANGKVVAIIALPDSMEVVGAKSFTPEEADNIFGNATHSQDYYSDEGTPEQWEVALDCYKVAIADLEAKKQQKSDTWW